MDFTNAIPKTTAAGAGGNTAPFAAAAVAGWLRDTPTPESEGVCQ